MRAVKQGEMPKERMRPKEDEDMDPGGLKKKSASSSKEVMDDEGVSDFTFSLT